MGEIAKGGGIDLNFILVTIAQDGLILAAFQVSPMAVLQTNNSDSWLTNVTLFSPG